MRVAPFLVAVILAALWLNDVPEAAIGFSMSAPSVAARGASAGVRAWHLTEQGVEAPLTEVDLRDANGRTIATTTLTKSSAQGSEGEVLIPSDAVGPLFLAARADIEDDEVVVLYGTSIEAERSWDQYQPGRETSPFQVYELGPMQVADGAIAPEQLDPRVEGGACVPELPCWLTVWVGNPTTELRVRSIAGVRPVELRLGPGNGFLRVPLTVVGNEARIELQVLGPGGQVVASREVRLPVAPGGLSARATVDGQRVRLDWNEFGGQRPVLVDVYQDNRWTHAFSATPEEPWLPHRFEPGVWRLQVKSDLFSGNTAGVAHVVIVEGDSSEALREAARVVLANGRRDGLDPLAIAAAEGQIPPEEAPDAIRALFGPLNFGVVSLAGTASRLEPDSDAARRERLRWIAAAVILAIGLFVSLALFRIELLAQARARHVLEAFEDDEPPPTTSPSLERWLWAFVLLVFALIGALALSKGWF